jgi:hypothetical protein
MNQPDPHDADVDRTLAALRSAAPPEGMEARIAERLAARDASAAASRFAAFLPQSAWLRGALAGFAAASLAFAALLFATHLIDPRTPQTANNSTAPATQSGHATNVALNTGQPCLDTTNARVPHASRGLLRDEWEEGRTSASAAHLIPASFAPSKPAPPTPLTAQERALVQFVRTATPAELAALNPAAQQKADADRQAAFQKFFAPSPELLAAEKAVEGTTRPGNSTSSQSN